MKKVLLTLLSLFILEFGVLAQTQFPKGIKVGKTPIGTSVIVVDSITQYSTGDIKFWKGALQLSPNLPNGFKIGTAAVTVGASEINALSGINGNVQAQLDDSLSIETLLNVDLNIDTLSSKDYVRTYAGSPGYADSIPQLTIAPTTGNIWINTSINELWYRSGNHWYNSQKTDSIYIPSSLQTGLLSCWEANNTTFVDLKSARNGVLNGGATVTNTTTKVGSYSVLVNGSTDYVSVTDDIAYHLTGSYTISTWFNTQGDNVGNGAIMTVYQNNGFTGAYYVAYNRVQNATYSYRSGMTPTNGSNSSNLTDNAWHHLITVFDGTGITEYIDGVKQVRDAMTGTPSNTWGYGIEFGRYYTTNVFLGYISQTAIWNRVITDAEALILYGTGNGKPYIEW
jgi:hypothetical protein